MNSLNFGHFYRIKARLGNYWYVLASFISKKNTLLLSIFYKLLQSKLVDNACLFVMDAKRISYSRFHTSFSAEKYFQVFAFVMVIHNTSRI